MTTDFHIEPSLIGRTADDSPSKWCYTGSGWIVIASLDRQNGSKTANHPVRPEIFDEHQTICDKAGG